MVNGKELNNFGKIQKFALFQTMGLLITLPGTLQLRNTLTDVAWHYKELIVEGFDRLYRDRVRRRFI